MKILPVLVFSLMTSGLLAQWDFGYKASIERGARLLQSYRLDEAAAEFRRAMGLAYDMHDESLLANALIGVGRTLYYKSDFTAAIDTISLGVAHFKKLHEHESLAAALLMLTNVYQDQGDYEKAFETNRQIDASDNYIGMQKQVQIGNLYASIEDYPAALLYYKQAFSIPHKRGEYPFRELNHRVARLYAVLRKFDSARYFYDQAFIGNPTSKTVRMGLGEYFNLRGQHDSALVLLLPLYREMDSTGEGNIKMGAMIGIAGAYSAQHAFNKAIEFAQPAYTMAAHADVRQHMRDAALLLSTLYDTLKNKDLAFAYYKKYVLLKDSMVNDQLRGKLYAFKNSEKSERELAAAANRWKMWIVSLVVLAGSILFLFFYRNLRYSNEKLVLKKRAADLEMQALRTQMNPHFIFNALSSINGFILNNQPTEAADYLARFSRLVRLVLELSSKKSILLQDEIQILRLYLEMESLRFRNRFTWQIREDPDLDGVLVPPLIFQPFCENAIWHGLLHKDSPGSLQIEFCKRQEILSCIITDDGVGRTVASTLDRPGKERRLGLGITAERLLLFNQSTFAIEDLQEGTRVSIKIKLHDQDYHRGR